MTAVQNPTGQDISVDSPPARGSNPEQNLRTDTVYAAAGQAIGVEGPDGVVTRTYYDGLGRVWFVVGNLTGWPVENQDPPPYNPAYPDEKVGADTVYDGKGDATATFTYDALSRLKTEKDTLDHTTTYAYDMAGNRTSVLDAEGFTTAHLYDDLGRLKAIDYPAPDCGRDLLLRRRRRPRLHDRWGGGHELGI